MALDEVASTTTSSLAAALLAAGGVYFPLPLLLLPSPLLGDESPIASVAGLFRSLPPNSSDHRHQNAQGSKPYGSDTKCQILKLQRNAITWMIQWMNTQRSELFPN